MDRFFHLCLDVFFEEVFVSVGAVIWGFDQCSKGNNVCTFKNQQEISILYLKQDSTKDLMYDE